MTGGGQDQAEIKAGQCETDLRRPFGERSHLHELKPESRIKNLDPISPSEYGVQEDEIDGEDEDEEEDEEEDDLLSEALLAVSSAEEYAAKIIKLQQSCLTPLKEDLANWLNKIMNVTNITTDNFMEKLGNGVIICKLAKIISLWCEQQLAANSLNPSMVSHQSSPQAHPRTASQQKLTDIASLNNTYSSYPHRGYSATKLSISTLNVSRINYQHC